jgi:hypothetical protein
MGGTRIEQVHSRKMEIHSLLEAIDRSIVSLIEIGTLPLESQWADRSKVGD